MTNLAAYEDIKNRHVRRGTGADDEPPRFRLIEFRDIALATTALYLVKGIVPREGLVIVYGAPKSGKSFWAFDLTMHVALGWEYRGHRVAPGPVVYVACEGERGLGARVEAFRRAKLSESPERVPFFLLTTRLDLAKDHPILIRDIAAQIGDEKPVAVVLDTLNRSLSGSESSDEDMGAYIKGADAIREAFSCAVIVIHHCGLEAGRPRGHTSLAGAADAQIAVKREEGTGAVVATVELMKDGATGAEIRSTLKVVDLDEDEDGEPITSCIIEPADGEATAPRRSDARVPKGAKTALRLLRKALEEHGELPPVSNHIPANVSAVPIDLWRRYCYAGTVASADNPEAKRKAFNRAAEKLQEIGAIGVWDDWVWSAA